jgi:hypothetical protein
MALQIKNKLILNKNRLNLVTFTGFFRIIYKLK